MSYGILYRTIAIKHPTDDKYLILSEYGDNNVWEHNNKRRARSWGGDCIAGSQRGNFCTPAELEAALRTIDFSSGCYAVYGGRRDFGAHWAVYKRAIKNAVQFDQLPIFGLYFSQWAGNERRSFRTINDLETLVSEQNRLENEGHSYYLNCYVSDWDYEKIYPKVKREIKVVQNPTHVISIIGYGYFTKRSSRRLSYTYDKGRGKGFVSEKDAQRTLEKFQKSYSNLKFEIVPIKK